MPTKKSNRKPPQSQEIASLRSESKRLQQENDALKEQLVAITSKKPKKSRKWYKNALTVLLLTVSVVSFMLFNVSSWVKNTILDTDTFVATMQPLISQPAVQENITQEISTRLFENVNVEEQLENVLPDQVAFLSGPLANQVVSVTEGRIQKVISSPQVYTLWGEALGKAQTAVVGYIQNDNNDGVVDVNDVYTKISANVSSDDKLSFLFNRQLPPKVGTITLAEIQWLPQARSYINMLSVAPPVFLATSLVTLLGAVLLSVKKRRLVIVFLVLSLVMMFATIAALSLGNWQLGNSVNPENKGLAQAVYTTITEPLKNRTISYGTLLFAITIVAIVSAPIAWIKRVRQYVDTTIVHLATKLLPTVSLPRWLIDFSAYISVISWTLFIALFVIVGVRIPPDYNQVITGFAWATFASIVLYIVHVCVRVMNRPSAQ